MQSIPIEELPSSAAALREKLAAAREFVLTARSEPFALITPIRAEDFEAEATAVGRARSRLAVRGIRRTARSHGLETLVPARVGALIAKALRDRRSRRRH
jgi:antitoxin (DNA-binding transcriptional repressor) of toxin-antitoxin stability system